MTTHTWRLAALALAVVAAGCATPAGPTAEHKRRHIRGMHDMALLDLYRAQPELQARLESAPGYGVFSNSGMRVIMVGGEGGYGVVVDNETGEHHYMRMSEFGIGPGLGMKDYRAVYIFNDREAMREFVWYGWEVGGNLEASVISGGDTGAAAAMHGRLTGDATTPAAAATSQTGGVTSAGSAAMTAGPRIEMYQVTKNGFLLEATLSGTRFYRYDELN